ncbi:MAG: hypothetical protein ACYSWO_22770 [Planctomycetota bacterium]
MTDGTSRRRSWLILLVGCPICLLGIIPQTAAAQEWTQFEMNRKDARGEYLWTEAENWNKGLPNAELSVEIGDDHSGRALHCVIPRGYKAVCQNLELAEHGRTQGTTLRLGEGASLTILNQAVLSKDRESWFYLDGELNCPKANNSLRVGGPWGRPDVNEPARCHLIVGPTGVVDAWHVAINTHLRAESAPSSPWGPKFWARSTGSEIIVTGGKLIARQGLRMSTCDADRPGKLALRGRATFKSERDSRYGIDIWCGVWEIDGSGATIDVGYIEFWGDKFRDAVNTKTKTKVGAGLSVLKLTGDGISTIRARKVDFVGAAVLDVGGLSVPAGTYKVIDATAIGRTNLRFAEGTDTVKWSFRFDREAGDLMLTCSR